MGQPTRVYIGKLSMRTSERDIDDMFRKFGDIAKVDMKNGFAFIEFHDERDADDAIREMDGRDIDGNRIQVERAKGPRAGQGRSSGQRTDFRLRVENLSRDVSWQDLKDFARGGGRLMPLYTDVTGGVGVIEYRTYDDMKEAIRMLHDTELRGSYVKLREENGGGGGGGGRDRRSPPRGGGGGYSSGYRSRSPPRRRPEDYSPPRYRSGGGGGGGYRSRSRSR